MNADLAATLEAADANKDGVIDLEEFRVFLQMLNDYEKKHYGHGKGPEFSSDESAQLYQIYNRINPEVEGIAIQDFEVTEAALHKFNDLLFNWSFKIYIDACFSGSCIAKAIDWCNSNGGKLTYS